MSLSEDEHSAWRELERSLTAGPGTVLPDDPLTLTVPAAAWHVLLPRLIAAVGVLALLAGLAIGVPLFVIAGIVVLCFCPSRRRRRARDRHSFSSGAVMP